MSAVLFVSDVLVSPSSVVTGCYEDVSLDSDWEFVEPQSFSFSKKRSIMREENRGEMSYEGMPVKALPNTRRRMLPPMPQQSSHSSTDERQWQAEMEVQGSIWSARERTEIAMMENYLDKSDELRVQVRELEHLMGPEDSEVNLMYILTKGIRSNSILEIFSTSGSDHFVASRNTTRRKRSSSKKDCK